MKKLSRSALRRAETFIGTYARPFEQALFATLLDDTAADWALNELATFQNDDGGFGHGLEPDVQMAGSSILATTVALQHLRALQLTDQHPLVVGAMRYLVDTFDKTAMAWPFVPTQVGDAPHAPWWQYNADLSNFLANPRAEIVGYIFDYSELFPTELRQKLLSEAIEYLAKADTDLSMHDLLCYVRLVETKNLPDYARDRLLALLQPLISIGVENDPAAWDGYTLKPLMIAPKPSSLFADSLQKIIDKNLDYEIDRQNKDGSWSPNWSWGEAYQEAWPHAMRSWQGILTVATCKTLSDYNRVEIT